MHLYRGLNRVHTGRLQERVIITSKIENSHFTIEVLPFWKLGIHCFYAHFEQCQQLGGAVINAFFTNFQALLINGPRIFEKELYQRILPHKVRFVAKNSSPQSRICTQEFFPTKLDFYPRILPHKVGIVPKNSSPQSRNFTQEFFPTK